MIQRDITKLEPIFRSKVEKLLALLALDDVWLSDKYKPFVNEARRELSTQMAYYSRSRMKAEEVKAMFAAAGLWALSDAETQVASTWTLKSKHIDGLAVDIVPMKNGKVDWSAPVYIWMRIGYYADQLGLSWGGSWHNQDNPHVEVK